MTTKFDIGEEVLVKAKIRSINIQDESHIYYTVDLESILGVGPVQIVQLNENNIFKEDKVKYDLNKGTVTINKTYRITSEGRVVCDDQ